MVNMFKDPYGTFQRWWLQGELSHRVETWQGNLHKSSIIATDKWYDNMECLRVLEVRSKAPEPGKRGNPGKEVIFSTLSGERFLMTMSVFREWDGSKEAIADYKFRGSRILDPSLPRRVTRKQQLDSLRRVKSIARFRNRSSSSGATTPSSFRSAASREDQDYVPDVRMEGSEQERLDAIIKNRLGGASLARSPEPRRRCLTRRIQVRFDHDLVQSSQRKELKE